MQTFCFCCMGLAMGTVLGELRPWLVMPRRQRQKPHQRQRYAQARLLFALWVLSFICQALSILGLIEFKPPH